jgi:SAM-dependent methyltransferase
LHGSLSSILIMNSTNDQWYQNFLICPDCHGQLSFQDGIVECRECSYKKKVVEQLDLRPISPKSDKIIFPRLMSKLPSSCLENINTDKPLLTYKGPSAQRDSRGLFSEIAQYLYPGSSLIDLGCGPRDQAAPANHLGYRYVGVDYSSPSADILADAHALPFRSNVFDCVFSYAVLEHLHNPFIAIREIERVLNPGGIFIGTVSQGEPFHASYFHHTAWGVICLIESTAYLHLQRLWDSGDTLGSLARMGRYPCLIKAILMLLEKIHDHLPFLAPRRMRWSPKEKQLDKIYRAGSICFVAKKATSKEQ